MDSLEQLVADIMADEQNASYTEQGIKPLFTVPKTARINIVGQAPGIRAQESGLYWNDPSGDNLRKWLGVDRETFYNSGLFAVVPMDYYFPGKGKSGDLAPRKGFADKWHKRTLALAPNIELHILVGSYAQRYYLKQKSSAKLTDTVKHYIDYLPEFFPLVHPSPRNNIWLRKNPWFEEEVIPDLQKRVKAILEK
ncbi:Uracil-DNA glycosylase [Streptococcus infantarius subsp. infantarius]|nr:Uracil-DNA glycosylase [Streptococcus infantarius subsp. infantarius]MCO4597305.1 Uracil-DNA glycosylase [Streptococcus infantarius subsp. infantarius]MCO4601914.1 Uracil-DNA glycosylase [Streptococcus infantarius subsp. infantarius]MCO4603440.1 Uracil-DNA glycosylase [Streptococcus infantarius subsp. infantarius]MCO4618408.1 Uracil-DNA glycosylase [Streptococcus infantarius subsp. infantarius]